MNGNGLGDKVYYGTGFRDNYPADGNPDELRNWRIGNTHACADDKPDGKANGNPDA